ncbi:hypothetical protein ACJ77P_08205 [Syntrophus buswellii]|uniref:hypothetical protein n=1 Tax=Syntrophus buswellii TaxID=43774 RepID=UPI0038D3FB8A
MSEEQKEVKGTFKFDKDTKRFHRFQVEVEGGITGSVFIPKDADIPKVITMEYTKKQA